VSPKRARQNRTYSVLRAEFLTAHPRCEFPGGCTEWADTVQHLRGRRGERLNDTTYWAASCLPHNLWAEDNTGEALAMGWLIRIEGAA
jgi:hypothetical protein